MDSIEFPLQAIDSAIGDRFEAQVQTVPQSIAIASKNYQWTYQTLNSRANAIANYILSSCDNDLERIALLLEHDGPAIASILAVLKLGKIYIPLDPTYPRSRLKYIWQDSQPQIILTNNRNWDLAQKITPGKIAITNLDRIESSTTVPNLALSISPEKPAYILYTSGSTGVPKGVVQTHRNVLHFIRAYSNNLHINGSDKLTLLSSYSFDAAIIDIFAALLNGATLCLFDLKQESFASLGTWLSQAKITIYHSTPTVYRQLIEILKQKSRGAEQTQLDWIRFVVLGGEAALKTDVDSYKQYFPPNCLLMNLMGCSESSLNFQYVINKQTAIAGKVVPVGYPVAQTELLLLDEVGKPALESGEIAIRSPYIALGYWQKPELTETVFLSDPEGGKGRIYRSGDLGKLRPDGVLEFLGRKDFQVKIRGFRVELPEIEAILVQHPKVLSVVVTSIEDSPGNPRLVAYLVPDHKLVPTISELRSFLSEQLPDYMMPSAFVILDALPLTPNNKIDRLALPVPEVSRLHLSTPFVQPSSNSQKVLADIWSALLGVEVGIHDNFFELGGHSILAARVLSRIRDVFDIDLPVYVLFESPTIAELTLRIETSIKGDGEQKTKAIATASRNQNLPSSFIQEEFWYLIQQDRNSAIYYTIKAAWRLTGVLNLTALERAVTEIVSRHEILRTTFKLTNGLLVQVVAPCLQIPVPVIDLQNLSPEEQSETLKKYAQEELERPFDLADGPLLRIMVLRLGAKSHVLLLTMSHIIGDAWSTGIFFQELMTIYSAFASGKPSPLPKLSVQYADFACWQREQLTDQILQPQLEYWKKQLSDSLPLLELPTDRSRPSEQTFRGGRQRFHAGADLTAKLLELSQGEGTTLYMTLLAALATLLFHYSSQEDINIGTPVSQRNLVETESLIGPFLNLLVLRIKLQNNPTFRDLLSQVRQTVLQALVNQDVPYPQVIEAIQPERQLSHNPLFQVMLDWVNLPTSKLDELETFSLTTEPLLEVQDIEDQTTAVDLCLLVWETEGELNGYFQYSTDLFDAETISRMGEHFQVLLEAIVANPEIRVGELSLLTPWERHQLLVEWNDTQAEYPKNKCIHKLFEEQVKRTPDAVAVVFEEEQLTYRELNSRSNQVAHYLQSLGVGSEVVVGICVERSLEMMIGLLGILKAGAAYVPLDPDYPPERLAYILFDSQAVVLLTTKELAKRLPSLPEQVVCLDSDRELISTGSTGNPSLLVKSDNLAYIIYTSGSTGKPKGVQIVHSSVVNLLHSIAVCLGLGEHDTTVAITSISFDACVPEIYGLLSVGGKVAIASREATQDPAQLMESIDKHNPTVISGTPATWRMMLDALWGGIKEMKIISTGESLPRDLANKLLEKCASLWNLYGPTEVTVWATLDQVQVGQETVVIGRPIDNTQIYILDEHLQPVPIGVPGELHIGGAGLARGYRNRPELTAQKFIPNPFSDELDSRLYKTGDLARYLRDGKIEFIGRIDNQVKIRGFRIELPEIEVTLTQHPSLREAVVIVHEDSTGDKRLVAYIVTNEEVAVSVLRTFLKIKLPDYMVPSAFVFLDAIPLTPNGKINRRALPEPDASNFGSSTEKIAPRTPTEELLATIWAEVLGLEKVGIEENFFEIGGHSLKAMQAISRIGDTFSVELPLKKLFQLPTIAELAKDIEKARTEGKTGSQLPAIIPTARDGNIPLSFAQQRLWFLDLLEGKSATYNIPIAIELDGCLNISALEEALVEIVSRHEVLRVTFPAKNGTPFQVITPESNLELPIIDLQNIPEASRESEVQRLVQEEASQFFDIATELLVRFKLLRLSANSNILLLTMHHIVSDDWSVGVLFRELQVLYAAFSQHKSSPLPTLPIQYADFAKWQRQYLTPEVLASELNYWKQKLAGIPSQLELPTDKPRPVVRGFRGGSESFSVSGELTTKLLQVSQKYSATLFMTLLAAFSTLLYRYSGQTDIVVGSPIANRDRPEIESLIGFFVNTLVLRTTFAENPSFVSLLHQLRATCLDAYSHGYVPFEQLVEQLQPERNQSYTPLFQVMFALQYEEEEKTGESWELSGLKVRRLPTNNATSQFDITLWMRETESGLTGRWEYNTDLFDAETIHRMAVHFQNLLEAIVACPEQRVAFLSLMAEAERHQLLLNWNDTRAPHSDNYCLHKLFEKQVERTPDTIAIVFESEQLTYGELNSRVNQLARYLQSLGVGPEVLVGICVERSLSMIVGLLGILKAGGAYLPLDPDYPPERLAYIISDSQVKVLVTTKELTVRLQSLPELVVCLDSDWESISSCSTENPSSPVNPDNLAYIIYTSGSTGKPKGVEICHQSLVNFLRGMAITPGLTEADTILAVTIISFDIAALEIYLPLIVGAKIVLASREVATDGQQLLSKLELSGATVMQATPATWQMLFTCAWQGSSQLKILCGGEALSKQLATQLLGKGSSVWNLYGPTEATVWSTVCPVSADDLIDSNENVTVSIGTPIANTQIYILDKYLQPVPIGVLGELHIGGAGLARGYLNRPELTKQKFIPNPFSPELGSRLYKTGDKARYLCDGKIEFIGRIDNQVKIRGFRIELPEIEAVLTQYPNVGEAVIIVREDTPEDKRIVAYIVAKAEVKSSQLRSFLRTKLPGYMIPSAFVFLDAIPLTPNGKTNRRALPAPDTAHLSQKAGIAPRSTAELKLVQMWSEVLHIPTLGVQDNFFELGGHSLLAVGLMARIEQEFGTHLPLTTLFTEPTIESQASLLSLATETQPFSPLVAIQKTGDLPPLFCVHPVGGNVFCYVKLANSLGNNRPVYGLQSPGLSGNSQPLTNVKDMAACYIKALQGVQPRGPYYLGGWSMGGVVAWEMAQQLQELGEEVALVVLIDSYAPRAMSEREKIDQAIVANSLATDWGRLFGTEMLISDHNIEQLKPEEQLQGIFAAAKHQNLLPPEVGIEQMRQLFEVFKTNRIALANYQLQPYLGRVVLFCSSEPEQDRGWSSLVTDNWETCVIPGDHYGIMGEPHVGILAQKLAACLNRIR